MSVETRVIRGRTVERHGCRAQSSGKPFLRWRIEDIRATFDERSNKLSEPLPGWLSAPDSEMDTLHQKAYGLQAGPFNVPGSVHPATGELAELRRLGLHLTAEMLAKDTGHALPDPISGLFSAGSMRVTRRLIETKPVVTADHLVEFLRRHVAGDLGDHGHVDQAVATDDDRWCPPLCASLAVRSKVSIEAGKGLVFSVYRHAVPRLEQSPAYGVMCDERHVSIITVIDPAGNHTLICDQGEGGGLAH
jgi:hypothetical protein